MKGAFAAAVGVEWLKLRRATPVRVTTVLLVTGVPALAVAFLRVAVRAADGGTVTPASAKITAMLTGVGWDAYLGLAASVVAVAVLLGAGIVVGWCFGREFAEGTVTSLHALPVGRQTIAAAKLAVLAAWGTATCVLLTALVVAAGPLAGVGRPSVEVLPPAGRLLVVGLLTVLLALPFALPASVGRGYLAAIGSLLLVVAAAQVVVALGSGAWFPYAAPGLWAQEATQSTVGVGQLALVPVTTAVLLTVTLRWWRSPNLA